MNDWNHSNDHRHNQVPGYPPGYPHDPWPPQRKKSKWIAGLLAFFFPGLGYFYLGQMVKGIAIMLLIALDISAIVFSAEQLQNVMFIILLSFLLMIIYFYNLFDAIQSTDTVNDRQRHPGWPAGTYYGMAPGPVPGPAGPPPSPTAPPPGPMDPPLDPFDVAAGAIGSPADYHPGAAPGPMYPPPGPPPGPLGSPTGPGGLPQRGINGSGLILLAVGVIVLLLAADLGVGNWMFHSAGSMIGAVLLIGAGIGLWFWEMRGGQGRKH